MTRTIPCKEENNFGDAWLEQKGPFYVGTCYQFDITYEAGPRGIPKGGGFCVSIPGTIGWGTAQVKIHSEKMGYCTAWSSNPDIILVSEIMSPDVCGYQCPNRLVKVTVTRGNLLQGQRITLRIGDTRRGWGKGLMVGIVSSQRKGHEEYFGVSVDVKGKERFEPLIDIPVQIAPRGAESLEILAPSVAQIGEPITFSLKAQDLYCNLATCYSGELKIMPGKFRGIPSHLKFSKQDKGLKLVRKVVPASPGILRIQVQDKERKLKGKSNPLCVKQTLEERLLWGELHCHSALSVDNKKDGLQIRPADMYEIGHDVNRLDFMWITDHHTPWGNHQGCLNEKEWNELIQAAKGANRTGEFLALVGFEFGGREGRGDTNVLFLNTDVTRPGKELVDVEHLWKYYEQKGYPFMTIPHLHSKFSKFFENGQWPYRNIQRERLIEICSCHGRYEYFYNRPWLKTFDPPAHFRTVQDILAMGLRYGIVGGSDGHKGHPGQGAMTAVYVKNFTREGLWDGLMSRRCYATTHSRILLEFTLNYYPMGTEISFPVESMRDEKLSRTIRVRAAGTEPILKLDIVRNGKDCFSLHPNREDVEFEWKDNEAPELHTFYPDHDCFVYYYIRLYQADGEMAWSSPIWLNFL